MSDAAASIPAGAPATGTPAAGQPSLTVDYTDPARFLNRDIEWLEFNARVLDIAADQRNGDGCWQALQRSLSPPPPRSRSKCSDAAQ